MQFEWDDEKDRGNQRKHDGISFKSATLVFDDERCQFILDRIDESGEQRWHAIGATYPEPEKIAILLVVHVYREYQDGEGIIRILSARKADKNELRRYQEQKVD
jgi:uncharacterized DUF497 family protein